jgi:hypothetical protein
LLLDIFPYTYISELAKELADVIRDLIRLLLVEEVAHSLHNNHVL